MTDSPFHPLQISGALPRQFNNPFCYEPHPACREAMAQLTTWLSGKQSLFATTPVSPILCEEAARGKMFGVLLVERIADGATGYLAGYSGQMGGRSDWPLFVPAVFDYLQPNGYFKIHEAEIIAINRDIERLEKSWQVCRQGNFNKDDSDDPRPTFIKGRQEEESDAQYIKRRQFENAELHRWKLRQRERDAKSKQTEEQILSLKQLRRQKSDDLQRWLFNHFVMLNGREQRRALLDIFSTLPPSGSGECCEPRLLQYAFAHGMRPLSIAMMWWGESPHKEVRHHGQYYPACNKRCKPILQWMLQGIDVMPNKLEQPTSHKLEIIYEDEALCVIVKPSGMLSIPGKSGRESVAEVMRRRYKNTDSPLIVHRLDMDTSGLMIIAKTRTAYHNLQRQFANHEVHKRYVALLSHNLNESSGSVSLPLRPDLDDRPRQIVDMTHGRSALTRYEKVAPRRVHLFPLTGRTHQLRLHCAHCDGLDNPIVGDALYGTCADRLYLHAEQITFRHPSTGEMIVFTDKAPF